MRISAKRIFATGMTSILLTLGVAATAAADPGQGGPEYCNGPPGQTFSQFARAGFPPPQVVGAPPGTAVSSCAQIGNPGQGISGS